MLTTENGALGASIDNVQFFEQVDGTSLNTNKWVTATSSMSVAQTSGYITLNSGSAITTGASAILYSVKNIPLVSYLPVRVSFNALTNVGPQLNATMELGIGGASSGTGAMFDGAVFRWNSSAEFRCVVNNNGSETVSAPISAPAINDATLFDIILVEDLVQFFIDDVKVTEVEIPTGLSYPTSGGHLPVYARVYNGGTSPNTAPKLSIGQVVVVQEALNQNKSWGEILASVGNGAYQLPVSAFTQTANHTNSTSPASATLSNTAAGYTTLGGRYQFAAVAGATTDFALFAFQVPSGYQLFITDIAISCLNTGATVTTSATIFDWSLGVSSSAVSLATSESPPTSWAPRRIPLGTQGFITSAAIGTPANDVVRHFSIPIVCDSQRYVHVILQVPSGAATSSEIFRGDVAFNGYFEM